MNAAEIIKSSDDLLYAYNLLKLYLAALLLVPEQGVERDNTKAEIRVQLGEVERHLGMVREALQYSIADELEASRPPLH